jgi:hypothetical protein
MDEWVSQLALCHVWEEVYEFGDALYVFTCCEWWDGRFEVLDLQIIGGG